MNRGRHCTCVATLLAGILILFFSLPAAATERSPVTDAYLQQINSLFRQNNVPLGYAAFDEYNRVILKGEYADEQEVDRAFSLAQTVVGVRWVSPVTPENIRVKEWERRIGSLFSRARVVQQSGSPDTPPGPVRSRYAVVVGVGQFMEQGITPLQFAVRDAESFYRFLADAGKTSFPRENIIYLTNQQATKANIQNAFNRIKSLAREDDLVVFYMSSHGAPPDKNGAVNLVTYDTEVRPRERVWHTSLNEQMLRDFTEGVRAKRQVMILDTCFSNGAYRQVPGFLPPGGKSLGSDDREGYGISQGQGRRVLGSKDIVLEDSPRPRQTANAKNLNMDDGWGKVMVGASTGGQQSWESDQLRQSIFTYYFVDGLKKNNGSVRSAFYYAQPKVSERVRTEKDAEQSPQIMATTSNWDMRLARPR
ncbi:MAG: peptidase C14 caspase catalytic subunit p20 [Nitrospirae bacterium]|nr:MAG: peptidase C14 caspase catalytic subunit p20 [Nitrospirota bacterium]